MIGCSASWLVRSRSRIPGMTAKKKSEYAVPKLKKFSAEELDKESQKLLAALDEESKAVTNETEWKAFRDRWLARKNGILTQINDLWLKAAPSEKKRAYGVRFNDLSQQIKAAVQRAENRHKDIAVLKEPVAKAVKQAIRAVEATQALDITLPGTRRPLGAEHPIIKTMNEIVGVFRNLGYSVEEGPEIETDYYNFEALNFPPNHPARDTQDTLFIAGQESKPLRERLLLRTHTSPVQIRTMEKMKPPLRVVCPGKVHRNDAADATHSPIFHQVEGLAVDAHITFCDLKGTLDHAMKALFGSSVKTRFYPSFFPFTEPSADVQISCIFCGGRGYRDGGRCPNCKASGWIELLGCGMVDPNVYGFVDYDPKRVSGFAFGMGVERIAILKYGVDDIQLFFNGDVRVLEQFG
jgi:phenylalanyl-tRNA synthetase alpha chain